MSISFLAHLIKQFYNSICVFDFRRYNDLSIYPIKLMFDEHGWILAVNFDVEQDCFTLSVNNTPATELPNEAICVPDRPQLIEEQSIIKLNDKEIHLDRWSAESFQKQHCTNLDSQPTEHLLL